MEIEILNNNKNYYGFDLLKIILAFLVTMLHLGPMFDIDDSFHFMLTNCYTRVAVPTFFAISGFLLFGDMTNNKLKKQIKRLWILYIGWTMLYLPQIIINFNHTEKYCNMRIGMKFLVLIKKVFFNRKLDTPLVFSC